MCDMKGSISVSVVTTQHTGEEDMIDHRSNAHNLKWLKTVSNT